MSPWVAYAQSVLLWSSLPVLQMILPVYLHETGMNPGAIGVLMAIGPAVAIVWPPFVGLWADRARSKNTILFVLTAGGAAAALLYPLGTGFWYLAAVSLLLAVFQSAQGPLSDAILLEGLAASRRPYGPVRLAGTLGFAVTALAVSALMAVDPRVLFAVSGALALVNLAVISRLPPVRGHQSSGPKMPLGALFRDRTLVLMMAFALVASVSIGFYSNFFGLFFLSLGGSKAEVGTLLFLMAASELPFLLGADRLLARWGRRTWLSLAMAVVVGRFLLMVLVPSPGWMYPLSLLNGVTFIVFSFGIATYINREVDPALRASGQTVLGVALSAGRVIGAVGGGFLVEKTGMATTFFVLAALSFVALVTFWILSRPRLDRVQSE